MRLRIIPQIGWAALVLLVGFLVLWPLVPLALQAFGDDAAAFARLLELPGIWETISTTVVLAAGSTGLAVIVGTCLAWCASRLPRRLRSVGALIPLLPLLVPAVAAVSGWIFLLSPTVGYLNVLLRKLPFMPELYEGPINIYSFEWILILTGLLLSSFVYLFVHTSLQNMGGELEAAAATCGASPLRRFLTVTLPLLRPAILFAVGVVFLLGLGQFTAPLLLGRTESINVLTTEMFYLIQQFPIDFGLGAALGSPILLTGVALVMIQRLFLKDTHRFVVVAARSRHDEREASWVAAIVVVVYGLVTTVIPILALLHVSLSPFWTGNFSVNNLTLRHYRDVFSDHLFVDAMRTSVIASTVAVLLVIPAGFFCAMALLERSRVPGPLKTAIDLLVTVPVAVPASLLGFGVLYAYSGGPLPLYGTLAVIVVTYVALMVGYATRLQLATLMGIGNEFRDASATCGAGPLRTLVRVVLPLARRGVGASAAVTFVLLFHEFSASLMVRSVRTQVMGGVVYDVWTGGVYPQMAVVALVMVFATSIAVVFAMWVSGTHASPS